jgi:enolase
MTSEQPQQLKTGAAARGKRVAKYNRLMRVPYHRTLRMSEFGC